MLKHMCSVAFAAVLVPMAGAWDAAGHRVIARLAIEGMPAGTPDWIKSPAAVDRISDQAVVPDRWRSTKVAQLQHSANPDHYFDIEDLEPYDLKFADIPPLRLEFVKALLQTQCRKGWATPPKAVNPARDPDKTQEWPGFLPYSILEQYGKVQSAFRVVRVLEKLNDPRREAQLAQAKADATVNMGILAHYVGDAAQPLHTTKHHHGWVGDNPNGYTTDRGFHSYIDGGVIKHHKIDAADVRPVCKFDAKVDGKDPWPQVIIYIQRSFDQVTPLYELKKTGELEKSPGKEFIEHRLADAASMLEGLYQSAWEAAAPEKADIDEFVKYDGQVSG